MTLAACTLSLATAVLLYNAILACANGPTIFTVSVVPAGRGGNPRASAFEAKPVPGVTVTVKANWLFCIGCWSVMVPCPVKDPSTPSPFSSVTLQMESWQANPADTVVKAKDRVRPLPKGM